MTQGASMTIVEKVLFLRSVDFFAQTAIEDLGRVAALTTDMRFDAEETIFRAGEPVDAIHFIVEGRVAVERDAAPIRPLGAKEALGMVAALDQEPAPHTVRCIEPVYALKLNAHDFHDMLAHDYEQVRAVFRALCRMIRENS